MKKMIFIVLSVILHNFLFADNNEIAAWSYEVKKKSDDKFEIILNADISEKWYIYGINIEEGGPLPLNFYFEDSKNIRFLKEFIETETPQKLYDEIFKMNVPYYDKSVSFKAVVQIRNTQNNTLIIDGQACYMVDNSCVRVYQEIPIEFK